jgi:hypothetical protein
MRSKEITSGVFDGVMCVVSKPVDSIMSFSGDSTMEMFEKPVTHEEHGYRERYAALTISEVVIQHVGGRSK